ncbi:MAG: PDZ domain-containing protein [Akkermansiaceae bacterium]
MKRSVILLLLTSSVCLPANGEADINGLTSPDFLIREKAQKTFLPWIFENPGKAKQELLRLYLATEDPELRMRLIPALERAYFAPTKGYVGIKMRPTFLDGLGRFRGNQTTGKGIDVIQVMPGTPADKSGLRVGDVIVRMNGWEVAGGLDLNSVFADRIQSNPPGREIQLKIRRGKEEKDLVLTLGVLPAPSERAREILRAQVDEHPSVRGILPESLEEEVEEFRSWLRMEIEKDANSDR